MYVKIHIYINFSIYHRWTEIGHQECYWIKSITVFKSKRTGWCDWWKPRGRSAEVSIRAIFRLWYQLFSRSTNKNCLFCPRTSEWGFGYGRVGLRPDPSLHRFSLLASRAWRAVYYFVLFYQLNVWNRLLVGSRTKEKKILACRTEVIFYFIAFSRRVGANARHAKPRLPRALVL